MAAVVVPTRFALRPVVTVAVMMVACSSDGSSGGISNKRRRRRYVVVGCVVFVGLCVVVDVELQQDYLVEKTQEVCEAAEPPLHPMPSAKYEVAMVVVAANVHALCEVVAIAMVFFVLQPPHQSPSQRRGTDGGCGSGANYPRPSQGQASTIPMALGPSPSAPHPPLPRGQTDSSELATDNPSQAWPMDWRRGCTPRSRAWCAVAKRPRSRAGCRCGGSRHRMPRERSGEDCHFGSSAPTPYPPVAPRRIGGLCPRAKGAPIPMGAEKAFTKMAIHTQTSIGEAVTIV